MRRLFTYLKDYKKETFLGPLFKLIEATFELFVPLVIASIIDNGIKFGDKPYIVKMSLLLVALGIVGLICAVTAQYFAAKASVGFATKLRSALFCHIQSLSHNEVDKLGTSSLITRMTSDVNNVQTGLNLTIRLLLRSPLVVFGAMIMAFTIDSEAALIFVLTIPVLSAIVFGIMLVSIPLHKKVQGLLDKVLGLTRENLKGARVIRAFGIEDDETAKFNSANAALSSAQQFVGKVSALLNPLTYVVINVAIVVLIWVGAIKVDGGVISQGMVIALYNYMSQILVELIKLANLIITVTKSVASAKRISSVFEEKPSIVDGNNGDLSAESEYAVVFDNASLRHGDNKELSVENISFAVKKGETVGIIGGTGSGKSSVINLIPRFYDCENGNVFVDGINVKDYKLDDLRGKIGVVLQKAVLFKGTIRENLLWGNENATDEMLWDALETAQAKTAVENRIGQLDCEIEQGGKNLSGGQKQRLTIARALVRRPEILILDDSSSALDFATDAALRQAIRNLDYKPTVLVVSQRTSSIQYADKIVVMEDGKAVGIGTHGELLKNCEVYREIYNSQFRKEDTKQ